MRITKLGFYPSWKLCEQSELGILKEIKNKSNKVIGNEAFLKLVRNLFIENNN